MFAVPDSTPPSTPNSKRDADDNPSTTPAGPPPTDYTHNSYTPAGNPPSTIFGSSQFNSGLNSSGRPAFQPTGRLASSSLQRPQTGLFQSQEQSRGFGLTGSRPKPNYLPPASSPPIRTGFGALQDYSQDQDDDGDHEQYAEGETDEDGDHDYDEEMGDEEMADDYDETNGLEKSQTKRPSSNKLIGSFAEPPSSFPSEFPSKTSGSQYQTRYELAGLAAGLSASAKNVPIEESDDFVLETEQYMDSMDSDLVKGVKDTPAVLATTVKELSIVWANEVKASGNRDTELAQAVSISTLLLQLHHPPPMNNSNEVHTKSTGRPSSFRFSATSAGNKTIPTVTPLPKVLLDWLNDYQAGELSDVDEVLKSKGDYSANPQFWDAVIGSSTRGRLTDTIKLLQNANFSVAYTETPSGRRGPSFSGVQLQNIEVVIARTVKLLESCPAIESNNWDTRDAAWKLFRRRVTQTKVELRDFAEGDSYDKGDILDSRGGRGSLKGTSGLSLASRKAQSKVPWAIYEVLNTLYDQLLGSPDELINGAIDWMEAVISVAVWCDLEDSSTLSESLSASRTAFSRSGRGKSSAEPSEAVYRRRLGQAFGRVAAMNDDELSLDVSNPFEVGLACVFEDNVPGAIDILRCLSLPVVSATVEIASAGQWLPYKQANVMAGFDKSDLMVLRLDRNSQDQGVKKDDILLKYAKALSRKERFDSTSSEISKEGWELAMQVVGRIDDNELAPKSMGELLARIDVDSPERVDKILESSIRLGFADQGRKIAEVG
jgi:hypothetical protein